MTYDAIVVGAGPNGLAAAIRLAQARLHVLLIEAQAMVGGGMRTLPLTLPGFQHDICSAIHPLGMASPFLRTLPLSDYGLEWIQPSLPLAHPFDNGSAAALHPSIEDTAATLGMDGRRWQALFAPLAAAWEELAPAILGPRPSLRHPLLLARFGLAALPPAVLLGRLFFRQEQARGLFAGLAAHSMLPLERPISSAFGLVLGLLGHAVGWPLPRGGSQHIATAMAAHFQALGGVIETGHKVDSLDELPPARVIALDLAPRQLLRLAGTRLPAGYRRQIERYRYGLGVFKIDYALSAPVPWRAAACRQAGTVHLGSSLAAIAASERAAWCGQHTSEPYVLVVQPSLFDATRAPAGQHTLWAYCHTPPGSTVDRTAAIEAQIERYAPGFQDVILARTTHNCATFETYNPNYIGGDINCGVQDLGQLWTRPVVRWDPYSTPIAGLFLCSAATPPGGGVHGMCGFHAAESILRKHFR